MRSALRLLALGGLIVLLGLFEHLALTRQGLQRYVDGAAVRGADAVRRGESPTAAVEAYWQRASALRAGDSFVVEQRLGPDDRIDGPMVRVRLRTWWRPPLLSALTRWHLPLEIRAAAAPVALEPAVPPKVMRVE